MGFKCRLGKLSITTFAILSCYFHSSFAAMDDAKINNVEQWKAQLGDELQKQGVSSTNIDDLLQASQDSRILTSKIEFDESIYLQRVLSVATLTRARNLLLTQSSQLSQLEKQYNVPAKMIAALWAVESTSSEFLPRYPAISLLANRAYRERDGYAARQSLVAAFKLRDAGIVDVAQLSAKPDGSIGDFGFSPVAISRYGVDFNRDGKIDVINDNEDILASYARALNHLGWNGSEIWGREVRLPPSMESQKLYTNRQISLQKWQQLGVRRADGSDLPSVAMMASIVKPKSVGGRAYMVYNNFYTLLRWKRSSDFALTVSLMSEMLDDKSDVTVFPFASN